MKFNILNGIIIVISICLIAISFNILHSHYLKNFCHLIRENISHYKMWCIVNIIGLIFVLLLTGINFSIQKWIVWILSLFVWISMIYIGFLCILLKQIFKLGALLSISMILMAGIFSAYLIIGANNILNVNILSYIMLSYLPALVFPFSLGFSHYLNNVIKCHKKVFGKYTFTKAINIYGPISLKIVSIFGIMATLISMVSSNNNEICIFCIPNNNMILIWVIYGVIYFLAPFSLIITWEGAMNKLINHIKHYGISYKVNKLYLK